MPNRAEAEKFLKLLEPKGDTFTFQTFDDDAKRKSKSLAHVLHGTLADHWNQLCALNKAGAGVYITVNETDLKGRKAENVTRIRAVFVDLDGAPLPPVLKKPLPHIVVESSPKRWHAYWRVNGMPLDAKEYREVQRQLVRKFKSDPAIVDLPRVLRLPGFVHQKGKPFNVRIHKVFNGKPFKAAVFAVKKSKQEETAAKRSTTREPADLIIVNIALDLIPSDDYKTWFEIGCAIAHEDLGFEVFDRWSRKSDKYDKEICELKWEECRKIHKYTVATIYHYANEIDPNWREPLETPSGVTLEHFVSFLPRHNYFFTLTGAYWPASSVNVCFPKQMIGAKRVKPSAWLDKYRSAKGLTWAPGEPLLIPDRLAREQGGWTEIPDTMCLNLYYPPVIKNADAKGGKRWVDLIKKIYPNDATHIVNFLAHRVQRPGEKINHALLLGGAQGIGKDTLLEPVKHAIGHWNFLEISPKDAISRFNSHIKSIICRISEARDLGGEFKSWDFYEHLKVLTASPPDIVQCEEKYEKKYAVTNVTSVIITTNYKTGGIYLPPDDRRTYVAWSDMQFNELPENYWDEIWTWYREGGFEQIAAYLRQHDLSNFKPKAKPDRTQAFLEIVESNRPTEEIDFYAVLSKMEWPNAITIAQLINATESHPFSEWLGERRNAKAIPHRLENCGYVGVINPQNNRNRWDFNMKRTNGSSVERRSFSVPIYAKKELPLGRQIDAARALVKHLQTDTLF